MTARGRLGPERRRLEVSGAARHRGRVGHLGGEALEWLFERVTAFDDPSLRMMNRSGCGLLVAILAAGASRRLGRAKQEAIGGEPL